MIRFLLLLAFVPSLALAAPAPLQPGHVAVVYNSNSEESRELASFYAEYRKIPLKNLVGLPLPEKETINRNTFVKSLRDPLRAEFTKRQWWTLGRDKDGVLLPTRSTIRCIALMRGVPLRISRVEVPAAEKDRKAQFNENNEASVDSELSLLGVDGLPIGGVFPNKYYDQDYPFIQSQLPFMLLVGRIDAKDTTTCKRMILDAMDTEETGLWGRTYIDFAKKGGNYTVGDQWLEAITRRSMGAGLPVITDRNKDTFLSHYPMTDAAVYFGWYTFHRNGPFLNPQMKFQKGAIAVHLHSLSAGQLRDPSKNWSAALLDRGAAATLGNTWEPYLQLSHNFNIFHDRLLKGYSLVEAAYMSINVLSWQNIVLGDPLYRPYKNFEDPPQDISTFKEYKAIRLAHLQWSDPAELTPKLRGAAARMKSGTIYEALGFGLLESKQYDQASAFFDSARDQFPSRIDKLRQLLNQVEVERRRGQPLKALKLLKFSRGRYQDLPQVKTIDSLITILDPPPPPPTKSKKK